MLHFFNRLLRQNWLFVTIAALLAIVLPLAWVLPAVSTAAKPPELTKIKINGKTENILLITRANDTVLVRCYPGFAPSLTVGRKQPNVATTGTIKCQQEKP